MAGAGAEARFAGLSLVQLNELLEDDAQLAAMVQRMEETQNVQLSKEMTLAGNRSLAEGNLLYQPRLDSLKARLTQRYRELQALLEACQLKKTRLDQQSSSASLETLLALLQAEGAKIEEDTENMAEKFLDGELALDAFIDVYQSQRKLAHTRRVKIEKLQEMVLKGQRLPQAPALPLPRVPEPVPTAPLPYPAAEASGPPSVLLGASLPHRPRCPRDAWPHLSRPPWAQDRPSRTQDSSAPRCRPARACPPSRDLRAARVAADPTGAPAEAPAPAAPHQPGFIL